MWQNIGEVALDAFLDTLKVFPFLLIIYVIIEVLEHKTSLTKNRKILQGKFAPLIGSFAGLIPLCGFSVMAAKLYEKRFIKTGTLLAVFVATSDEAVILLASNVTNPKSLWAILPLLLIKFVLAVAVGYAAAAILREKLPEVQPDQTPDYVCGHTHVDEKSNVDIFVLSPALHTLKISIYLFIISFAFGLIILAAGGEEALASSLAGNAFLQPLITSAIGLIPSCASSVILTSAYTGGVITFGSMTAGLIVNAGMGFMILLKNPRMLRRALVLAAALLCIAYVGGIGINLLEPYLFPTL